MYFTMYRRTHLIIIICLICLIGKGSVINPRQNCEQYTSQIINLFNLMCNNIANEDDTLVLNDCIQCFTLASRSNNNQPSLNGLSNCANIYITSSRYDDCADSITTASQFYNGQCVAGYCAFVKCIRRVNSDLLIAQCYTSASVDNSADLESEQITLYKNITSCILAITRCSAINPITGQRQTNRFPITTYNQWGNPTTSYVPLYNSLQINRAGDLRIIAFPETTKIQQYFCASNFNLRNSFWVNFSC